MSNLKVKNADGDDVFLAKGGAGTDLDPHTEPAQAVTAASLPLPSGAATAANQTTIIGHVDGIETALTTLDGRVDGVEALLTTVAGTVSGTEVQVDVLTVPANPFGANADAAVVAGAVGSMQAKLRLMTSQLDALITAINLVNVTHAGLIALNGAIAGTEVQVDVLTLPAVTGTVTVGSITAGNNNIGDVDVASVTLPTTIYHGKTMVTTAGTQVPLASSQAILSGVTVKALAANTGIIYVGASAVSSTDGFNLTAGEQVFIEVANLTTVWIDSSVTGTEGVSYIAT